MNCTHFFLRVLFQTLFVFSVTVRYNECTMSSLFQLFLGSCFVFTRFVFVIFLYFFSFSFFCIWPVGLSVQLPNIATKKKFFFCFLCFKIKVPSSFHVIWLFLLFFGFSCRLKLFKLLLLIFNFICILSHVHCALCTLKHNNIYSCTIL